MNQKFNRIIAFILLECLIITSFPIMTYAGPGQAVQTIPVVIQDEQDLYKETIFPGQGAVLEYSGVILDIPEGAVDQPVEITIQVLNSVKPLPGTMSNVTDGAVGYRFGPHGIKFQKDIKVSLPFDSKIAESEVALSNLFTYFYNEDSGHWERLEKVAIDRDHYRIISKTNHFTDMVNTTLQLPELPQGIDFDLNSIKELKAANPVEGIPGINGLDGNNSGAASFQIPLRIPAGRGSATPALGISYNSDGSTGWLGRGFDVYIPSITIDTRFGLPSYSDDDTFLLNGEELIPFQEFPGESLYRCRREGAFQRIRHITGAGVNYWEVTEKDGSISYYGQVEGWLGPDRTDRSKTFIWHLTRTVDSNGNTVDYSYQYDSDAQYTYLRQIGYSGHTSGLTGLYKIAFEADPDGRPDRRIDSRGTFPSKLGERLGRIEVLFDDDLVRAYSFEYSQNIFGQSQLVSYSEEDKDGNVFYTYGFDYNQLPERRDGETLLGYDAFTEEKRWGADDSSKSLDEKVSVSLGGSLSAGVHVYAPALIGRKSVAHLSINGGVNFGWDFSKSTLMDVNGDGLPDMVWKDGAALYSYLNEYNPSSGTGTFNTFNPYGITGVDNLINKGGQTGFSLGVSAGALAVSGSINKQYNWSESKSSFADVDGDGLVDIVDAGSSTWKRNNGTDTFVDMPWAFGNVSGGSGGLSAAQQDEFNRTYYQQEPLRRWNAYIPGTITVENEMALLDGFAVSNDGLDAHIYSGSDTRTTHLDRDNVSGSDDFTRPINKGDKIYFYLSTGEDERGDSLSWDTTIRYDEITLFDGLSQAAVLSPPSTTANTSLPGNDDRLASIYTLSGSHYVLRSNWQNYCTSRVYDALASLGFFVPRRIPLSSFRKIYNALSSQVAEGQTYSPRALLLLAFDFNPEQQLFIRKNNQADSTILDHAASVWTEAEKRELMFYRWLDGRQVYPSFNGSMATYKQSRSTSPASRIFNESDNFGIGDYVRDKGYLLDRVFDDNDKSLPLYLLWLREISEDTWSVYREEAVREITESGIIEVSESGATIRTGSLSASYTISGQTSLIEQIPSDLYLHTVDNAFMTDEVFSYKGIEEIPSSIYDQVYSSLSEANKPLLENSYTLDDVNNIYTLVDGITEENFLILLKWFDSSFPSSDSLFNVLPLDTGDEKRIILLDESEYQEFINFFQNEKQTDVSPWFTTIIEPGTEEEDPDIPWHTLNHLVIDTIQEEFETALYEYRRDWELFPYYQQTGDIFILKETIPEHAPSNWETIVETLWQDAGYHVWNRLSANLNFNSNDRLTVEPGILPPGASEITVAPGPTGTAGQETGVITLLSLDNQQDTVISEYYVPVFNSLEDYSTQDLVIYPDDIYPKEGDANLPDMNITFDDFSGGNGGWFYNQWCGYHTFNPNLIGSYPSQSSNSEVMIPPYTLNVVRNHNPSTGNPRIEQTGKSPVLQVPEDAWIGEISSYSEPVLDDDGNNSNVEYAFAAFTFGNEMYPSRKGGDAYYRVPQGNSPFSGGSLSVISKSKSDTTDISGGITVGIFGGNFSQNRGDSWQYAGLMDLNGDRYPDILSLPQDGGSTGTFASGTNGGFSDASEITLPFSHLSRYENLIYGLGASAGGGGPGITFAMNDKAKEYLASVQNSSPGFGGGVNGTLGQSIRQEGLIDINGDGLADHIRRTDIGNFEVQLNTGVNSWIPLSWTGGMNEYLADWPRYASNDGIIDCVSGGLEYSNTGSFGGNVSIGIGPATVIGGFNGNTQKTAFRLADVNGDGLPDQVGKHEDEDFFRVRFNLGDCFSDSTVKLYRPEWTIDIDNVLSDAVSHDLGLINGQMDGLSLPGAPLDVPGFDGFPSSGNNFEDAVDPLSVDDVLSYSSGVSFNLGASLSISWDWFLLALVLTPGVNGSFATTSTSLQFQDLNGDGLPDHILKLPGEEFVRVKENTLGKVGLLNSITLPAGGTVSLDYQKTGNTTDMPMSRYVLSFVSRNDGMDGMGPEGNGYTYTTSYSYDDGYYDREERQFFGFGTQTTTFGDGSYKVTDFHNRDYARKGLVDTERFYGPDRLYTETVYVYSPRTYYGIDNQESTFQALSQITSRYYGEEPENYTESIQVFDYDSYGNINYLEDQGSTFSDKDDYFLTVTYATLPGYRHGYPEEMTVVDSDNKLLRRRWGSYYENGNPREIRHYIESNRYASYNLTYDTYGNPRTMTGPRGMVQEYAYDPVLHQFPEQIDVYNTSNTRYRYTSSMEWDYAQGTNTARVDQNNQREERKYDSFGRLTDLISPYDLETNPAVSFDYYTDSFPWYTITKNKLRFDQADTQVMRTLTYIDGLGRVLMTAKDGETGYGNDRKTGWNCSGATLYDIKGRPVATGQAVFQEGPALPSLPGIIRPLRTTYDYLNRVTGKLLPDNSEISIEYLVEDHNFLTRTTDPLGNITEEIKGIREEVKAIRKKNAAGTILTGTSYEYDPLTQLTEARDHENNLVSFTYNLAGSRKTVDSPDGGLIEYFYDSAGNVTRKLDSNLRARGQSIEYRYDDFNRLYLIDYPWMADTEYFYGAPDESDNRAGRLVQRIDESGEISFAYGLLGENISITQSLHRIAPLSDDKTAAFTYQYDYLGRMEEITYPDGELLSYDYDSGGQVQSITGIRNGLTINYVQEIGYNEQGQRTYTKMGNGTETHYTYDPERRWIDNLRTVNGYGQVYQNITYDFDSVGNVEGYTNYADKYTTIQDYDYDDLYQLTDVTGSYEAKPYGLTDFVSSYRQGFSYDAIGNIESKVSEVTNNPAISRGQGLNYSLDYQYYPDKPHQVERIGKLWYLYDKNGNVIEERQGGHSPASTIPDNLVLQHEEREDGDLYILNYGFGLIRNHDDDTTGIHLRKFFWDEENRLKRSTDAMMTVEYLYDSDGNRTAKYTDRGESLYFNSMWSMTEDRPNFRESKHIYLGTSRIATKIKIEDDNSTGYKRLNTYYYNPDHLGSATLITDYKGGVYEHIEYTPYGELWIEEQSDSFEKITYRFTGKELDKENNLYYYGARYYNPQTSRWMKPDPAGSELINPQTEHFSIIEGVNWYSYCSNSPVNYIDPDGRNDEPLSLWDSYSRFIGMTAHIYIEAALQMQYPNGEREKPIQGMGFFKDGRVDFALPETIGSGEYDFYEIKPITQQAMTAGQTQLAEYCQKAGKMGFSASPGTSILGNIQGMRISDVLFSVPLVSGDVGHYIGDIRVISFPGDATKKGMIYYEVQNMRPNTELYLQQAKATVIVGGIALGLLLAPEIVAAGGGALIPQFVQ